jgi:hypothetical protein
MVSGGKSKMDEHGPLILQQYWAYHIASSTLSGNYPDLPQHDDHSWNIMGKSSVNMNVESRFGNGHCTLILP